MIKKISEETLKTALVEYGCIIYRYVSVFRGLEENNKTNDFDRKKTAYKDARQNALYVVQMVDEYMTKNPFAAAVMSEELSIMEEKCLDLLSNPYESGLPLLVTPPESSHVATKLFNRLSQHK